MLFSSFGEVFTVIEGKKCFHGNNVNVGKVPTFAAHQEMKKCLPRNLPVGRDSVLL